MSASVGKNHILPITCESPKCASPMKRKNHSLPITSEPPKSASPMKQHLQPVLRRTRTACYVSCAVIFCLAVSAVLILTLVVYKIRDPTMHLNSVSFGDLDLTRNLTILADVSVKNPNAATFTFKSSTTSLLYRSAVVGSAVGPPGTVVAHRTLRTNITVDVITVKLLNDSSFMNDLQNGWLVLDTCTTVGGKVRILGMFRHHVDVMMNCTVNVSVATQAILDQHCTQRMWL